MSKTPKPRPNPEKGDNSAKDRSSSFAWEFRGEEAAGEATSARMRHDGKPATHRMRDRAKSSVIDHDAATYAKQRSASGRANEPRAGNSNANYVRDQLDRGLDRWWSLGEVLPLQLLHDGLRMLEGGQAATESQRTLLLRSALAYDRGVQTALRHQSDPERVALILAEAAVEWEVPLEPKRLAAIARGSETIRQPLMAELERTRVLMGGEPRQRAQDALEVLRSLENGRSVITAAPVTPVRSRRPFRQVLLLLLVLAFVGFAWRQRQQAMPGGMVAMPAASYALLTSVSDGAADGAATSVRLEAFFIDRFEVTNRDYRICIEQGACLWPVHTTSATHADYFANPAFNQHPVVNVTQAMAAAYCEWAGKRLPTAAEWQAAASVSPTTGRPFRYPWGEAFEPQRANVAMNTAGDTLSVGSFRPAGDSPSGAADMAGNVAEWTSSTIDGSVAGESPSAPVIVKGGSYRSDASALFLGTHEVVAAGDALPHVGFRCSQSHLLPAAE